MNRNLIVPGIGGINLEVTHHKGIFSIQVGGGSSYDVNSHGLAQIAEAMACIAGVPKDEWQPVGSMPLNIEGQFDVWVPGFGRVADAWLSAFKQIVFSDDGETCTVEERKGKPTHYRMIPKGPKK